MINSLKANKQKTSTNSEWMVEFFFSFKNNINKKKVGYWSYDDFQLIDYIISIYDWDIDDEIYIDDPGFEKPIWMFFYYYYINDDATSKKK